MMFRGKLLIAACALIPTLFACGPADVQSEDSLSSQSAAVYEFPREVCPVTDPSCWPPPPEEPEPCTPEDGLINQYSTYNAGSEATDPTEVYWFGGTRCNRMVITGIGARVVNDSNYDMLKIWYRPLYANGTMGPETEVKIGNQFAVEEASVRLQAGYAIVGVGAGQFGTQDLKNLVLWYRKVELTAAGVRLTGPILWASSTGTLNGLDSQFTGYWDDKVLSGVGFKSSVEQTKTIKMQFGVLP